MLASQASSRRSTACTLPRRSTAGFLAEYFVLKAQLPQHWRLFLTTGVLGGFTTFSAFSLDAALLYERGKPALAAAYVLASVVLSITALFAALAITRSMVKV